jgi:hypothetical protein
MIALLVFASIVGVNADYIYGGFGNFSNPISLIPKTELMTGDLFGSQVAIWGGTCIVSASKRTYVGNAPDNEGLIFVFTQNDDRQWEDTGVRLASYRSDDGFGTSLSLYQGTAAIGAPNDNLNGVNSGCVHVFYSSTSPFGYSQELYAPYPQEGDLFGYSVAIVSGDAYYYDGGVVVGAYGHNYLYGPHDEKYVADVGCAFVFANKGGTWVVVTTMQPVTASEGAMFGYSVHASSGAIAIGAPGAASAYLFHLEPVQYDCPHEVREDEIPEECLDENGHPIHRQLATSNLRGDASISGAGTVTNETENGNNGIFSFFKKGIYSFNIGGKKRVLVGPPKYSVWEYIEVLHVQDEEKYEGNGFGSTVAVCNVSSPVLVVAAPTEMSSVSGSGVRSDPTGAVYVFSLMPPDDLPNDFVVPEPDPHGQPSHRRRLQFEGGAGAPGANRPGHYNVWYFRGGQYTRDKDGNSWAQSFQVTGTDVNYLYGYALDIFDDHLAVGVLGSKSVRGRVDVYTFDSTYPEGVSYDSSIDEQRNTLPVTSGKLYGKAWHRVGAALDQQGGNGDRFGSTTSIHEGVVVVGGSVTGWTDGYHIGTGQFSCLFC